MNRKNPENPPNQSDLSVPDRLTTKILDSIPKRPDQPAWSIIKILEKRGIKPENAIGQRFSFRRATEDPKVLGIITEISDLILDQSPPMALLTDFLVVRSPRLGRFEIPLNRQRIVTLSEPNQSR